MTKTSTKAKKRVFKTMRSIDRTYFPTFLAKQQDEKLTEEPTEFGAKLAKEVLSDIRKALR